MENFLADVRHEFRRYKLLADSAMSSLGSEEFFRRPAPHVNSVAIIVKHLAGNLASRWTDFLTTDGEKPWRNRDDEFVDTFESRAELLECWERGWACLLGALKGLKPEDLERTVLIRGEPHSVPLALERSLGHTCYHVGQIVQVARIHAGEREPVRGALATLDRLDPVRT